MEDLNVSEGISKSDSAEVFSFLAKRQGSEKLGKMAHVEELCKLKLHVMVGMIVHIMIVVVLLLS